MPTNNYILESQSDLLYDPARYTGIDQVVVDNDNDTIGLSGSFITTVNNKLDASTFATYTANHASDDITPYTAGANINITNHVVSGKDWSSDISNAVSPKLDTSTYTAYTAAHASDDVTPYTGGTGISITNHQVSCTGDITPYSGGTGISVNNHQISCTGDITSYTAGANINITNHVVSGKDWSSDISNATTGKIDKVTGGAGSETNPVYLNSSNVITPCFTNTNSVKLSPDNPSYFSGDAGGNVLLRGTNQSTHLTNYSIMNSVILGWQTNYNRGPSTKEHFDNCIFMNGYMYGYGDTPALSHNLIIGYNSISNAKNGTNGNTIIGTYNDFVDWGNAGREYETNTYIGYQNNAYSDMTSCTVIGSNNDIGNGSNTNNKEVYDVTIVGYNNEYQYDATTASPSDGLIIGGHNNITSRQNNKTMIVGFDNNLTGNCTYLIGDGLAANNEGSYSNKIMKVGLGTTHLQVESSGSIKQVINGTASEIQNKLSDITDVQVVSVLPASPVANVLYLVKE